MAVAAATAAKLIERMLAISGRCSEIVTGRASHMGRASREVRNRASTSPVQTSARAALAVQ